MKWLFQFRSPLLEFFDFFSFRYLDVCSLSLLYYSIYSNNNIRKNYIGFPFEIFG